MSALPQKVGNAMWVHVATFEGKNNFPIDMLRYDSCFPDSQEDVLKILNSYSHGQEPRTITVRTYCSVKNPTEPFTILRWGSFGWRLVP